MRLLITALLACCACAVQAKPAELVTLPQAPPPGPWRMMRDTLDHCAVTYGLVGDMQARIELDEFGKVISVEAGYGDGFASCVGNALMATRYRSHANRALLISFTPPRA